MRLKKLKTKMLHGGLNLDLKFFPDLNILVGINGSGKTSALNVIDWMLKPNLAKLAVTSFKSLELTIDHSGSEVRIYATKTNELVSIHVSKDSIKFKPITIDLIKFGGGSSTPREEMFKHLGPEKHELPAWNCLQEIGQPTFVSLERTLTAEIDDEIYLENASRSTRSFHRSARTTPLAYVRELFRKRYAEYRKQANKNDADLKSKIILAALHSPNVEEPNLPAFQMPQPSTEQLEERVVGYLATSTSAVNVSEHIRKFFEYYRRLASEVEENIEKSGEVIDLVRAQFARVEQLASAFNEFEKQNAQAFLELRSYLEEVNKFLIDSGKEVSADDSRGELVFRFLQSTTLEAENRSISLLSSGETQIVILFALAAFEASKGSVFVVDEPELSLHPKWQNDFMSSFLKLCGDRSQVFVATHSPEIVGTRKTNCVFF